eukprot:7746035-Pyramimonas_sp.AAC.1
MDDDWALRLDLTHQDAATWLWTRAHAGLPAWLRSQTMLPPVKKTTCPPYVFPTVKSKCFDADGTKKCAKAGHSCMRRIVNSAEAPGTAGYKCVGRAARHLLRASGTSCEVFNMNDAAAELRQISD